VSTARAARAGGVGHCPDFTAQVRISPRSVRPSQRAPVCPLGKALLPQRLPQTYAFALDQSTRMSPDAVHTRATAIATAHSQTTGIMGLTKRIDEGRGSVTPPVRIVSIIISRAARINCRGVDSQDCTRTRDPGAWKSEVGALCACYTHIRAVARSHMRHGGSRSA